ncbi:amidase signature enzyme [Phlegmacium glaucopus]|nr:amidase signature enzyme [Phlegmacium glaucopus]
MTYAKKTLVTQKITICVTEIMFEESLVIPPAANWGPGINTMNDPTCERSLMGVKVYRDYSKIYAQTDRIHLDTVDIKGYDSTIGYSRNVGRPSATSSSIACLLQDAGALIHVQTTVPTGLLAIEKVSDICLTTNLYRRRQHTGSRWWKQNRDWGCGSSLIGLEGLPIVTSPLVGNLEDLHEFSKRAILANPCQYDRTCVPLPWQHVNLRDEGRKVKWGVIWEDGTIPPTPACKRALKQVVSALKKQGHEVVDFQPPNIWEGLKIGYQLLFSDGGQQILNALSPNETISPAAQSILDLLQLPESSRRSSLSSIAESIVARDLYREEWHRKWTEEGLDFVLTVPHSFPALENGTSEQTTLTSAGYTLLFILLDYTAGVLPVTFVDKTLDGLPQD